MKFIKLGSYLVGLGVLMHLSPATYANEAECNKLATYPSETDSGVADDKFDAVNALLACKPAADAAPDNAELHMFTARAYIALNKAKEAYDYLGKAANKGSWLAQLTIYDWATRNPPIVNLPHETKMQLLTAAAKSGPPRVRIQLLLNYAQGRFTKKDASKASAIAKELAEEGSPAGMRLYAQLIDGGSVAGADKADARIWLEKAANAGDAEAMHLLGESMLKTSDYKKGFDWLKKAAGLNYVPSQRRVISNLRNGLDRIKADKRQADRLLKQWASKDFLFAIVSLGQDHTEKGLKSGPAYLQRAFDAGHDESGWFLVKHYNEKKDKINTQKWLDILWDKGDLAKKARVLDFYDKEKDLAGFSRAFARMEAELLKQDETEGLFASVQMLSGRYNLLGLTKYWKATEKNIALYLQKGGNIAANKVAALLLPYVERQAEFYNRAENRGRDFVKIGINYDFNRHYGPMYKSMYETLLDIFLNDKIDSQDPQARQLRSKFANDRKTFSNAADVAQEIHTIGLKKITASNNLAIFLRRGYVRDCGARPNPPSDRANAKTVSESNARDKKWRACLTAKWDEADTRKNGLGAWSGYRETNMGFEKYSIQGLHNQTIVAYMDKINDDRETLNKAIKARNERIAARNAKK